MKAYVTEIYAYARVKTSEPIDDETAMFIMERELFGRRAWIAKVEHVVEDDKAKTLGFPGRKVVMCIENLCMVKPPGIIAALIDNEATGIDSLIAMYIVKDMDGMAIALNEMDLKMLMKTYEQAETDEERDAIIEMMTNSLTEVRVEEEPGTLKAVKGERREDAHAKIPGEG